MSGYVKGSPFITTPGQWRACIGKKSYPSKRNAAGHARALNVKNRDTLNEYRCVHCGSWHLGHARRGAA